jgi:type I restriction-modification system DNA methylase subunit
MTDAEQRAAAKKFAADWKDKGYEKGMSQPFWLSLLRDVLGIEHPEQYITFEEQVHLDHTSFIDGFIPSTKVLVEQKGLNKDLRKAIKQSDGSLLTPFQQAKRYVTELPLSKHPRYIVTCNFAEFNIYDMEKPSGEPEIIKLEDLGKEYYRLQFLVDVTDDNIRKEEDISLQAGDIVGLLYDEILKQYKNPESEETLKSLNMLCVRLVFCLYAEDAGIFEGHNKFHNYLKEIADKDIGGVRRGLIDLFKVLDTKPEDRDPYIDEALDAFPYVNGGLFADENIEIPRFTEKIIHIILEDASANFDWSVISPTIFGAVFESTLNPDTRRNGGMHYTSIQNIHKVIDPLFLNELKDELDKIKSYKTESTRIEKVHEFQNKLASLKFLDPACGSGNFLTETYISLRRLENEAITLLTGGQMVLGAVLDPVKVSISQFYGIEVNDFAVTVGKTALWIAESQMLKETEDIVHQQLEFLPLKTNANIVEGNALRIDWNDVVPSYQLNYIMGNPPFLGYSLQSASQKADIKHVAPDIGSNVDYVAMWYYKAASYIANTRIRVAFVSTNSITQGEQVAVIWKPLYERYHIHIDFAYRTFQWDSEANIKAHVHVIIIGFSSANSSQKFLLFESDRYKEVSVINPYLMEAEPIFIERRNKPICDVPQIYRGSQPTDDGNFIFTEEEMQDFLSKEPQASSLFRPYMMGKDFINRKYRYCLWLEGVAPDVLKKCPKVMERVKNVREFRAASKKEATRKKAETPTLFDENHECKTSYIAIPKVSSQNRRYIPMELLSAEVIAGDKLFMMPEASLYSFGVLMSNVHMAWMRTVGGRLKSDYSYSNTIVYNNFPWCDPTPEQRTKIEQTAQGILDARALYPNSSLADLYDEIAMPPELRRAHQLNNRAVMQAYGFPIKDFTESDCVAALMKMYQSLNESFDK